MTWVAWPDWNAKGSWDQAIVHELTEGNDYEYGKALPLGEGGVVVIPGQHHVKGADLLAAQIADLPWALTIVTSDEEALFPVELLPRDEKHAIWGQYHARPEFERIIPIGAPPNTPTMRDDVPRDLAVSFVGQATHARRTELVDTLKEMAYSTGHGNIAWLATTGFRQGLDRDEYLATLARTRIAPCPSGPHSLDSFRLYEALAAGALPIIETCTPHGDEGEFWDALFGPHRPIPRVASWTEALPLLVEDYADVAIWREERHEVARWWQAYHEDLQIDFERTIRRLRES